MRVLVTVGSTRGGTEGLGELVTQDLRAEGFDVDFRPPAQVRKLDGYDAVIVGGALYAFRWHRAARRFVRRHAAELRARPVWFFSSGPLDDSASRTDIPPVKGVKAVMQQIGVRGHATFGGRLAPDAQGFPASAMAKKLSGDWRDPAQVKEWAHTVAGELRSLPGRLSRQPRSHAPRRRTSHTDPAMSAPDATSTQPPSMSWNGQNRESG